MRDALVVSLLSLVPRNRAASGMGWFARSGASRLLTRAFVWAYGVDLDQAVESDLSAYGTLEALFTRRLKPGLRPVDADPEAVVSPVDGAVAFAGRVDDGWVPLGAGRGQDLSALVGRPVEGARSVAVLYLSPTDYHRVHAPVAGLVQEVRYAPGSLWPVFPAAVRRVRNLFARNERAALTLACGEHTLDVVLVGAFGVGRMEAVGLPAPTNTGAPAATYHPAPPPSLAAGDELGVFHLGSTVVLSAPATWTWTVSEGDRVQVGRALGRRG